MGFPSGSVSFRRFKVVGEQPTLIDQALLDKIAEHRMQVGEFSVPEETEYGWCGGRHVFDGKFSHQHNVFAEAIHFALRIDTNRVPGELKKAYQLMEEEAAGKENPSGHASKKQKKDVKEVVRAKVEEDLKSGKFRRSKLVPLLWDLPTATVYSSCSASAFEKLAEIFERTFNLQLEPVSTGTLALAWAEEKKKRHEYEDTKPTRFVNGPDGEGQYPEYPWTAKGATPKDFLGNEFLLWLWHEADAKEGVIKTEGAGEIALLMDRSLELDCAYGQTGKDTLRAEGPTRMPEARDGLRSGKLPRKTGLVIETAGKQYTLNLNAESLACGGVVMPEVEEAEDARVLFEERIPMLRDLCSGLDALFHAFLKVRLSSSWEGTTSTLRKWILQSSKPQVTISPVVREVPEMAVAS